MTKSLPIYYLVFLFFLISCHSKEDRDALVMAQLKQQIAEKELVRAKAALEVVKQEQSYALVHLVFFTFKSDLSDTQKTVFLDRLKELGNIPEVHSFKVGTFVDLNDPRALNEYDAVISMAFENEGAYQTYQKSTIHQQVKQSLAVFLAAKPAAYDYSLQ